MDFFYMQKELRRFTESPQAFVLVFALNQAISMHYLQMSQIISMPPKKMSMLFSEEFNKRVPYRYKTAHKSAK